MFAPPVAKPQTKPAASPTAKLASQRPTSATRPSGSRAVDQPHAPRRSVGNQSAPRFLSQLGLRPTGNEIGIHDEQQADASSSLTRQMARPGWSFDFSKLPLTPPDPAHLARPASSLAALPSPGILQPKLAIGRVNDPLEHEADRVANQVMRMPDPGLAITSAPARVSRKCAGCEEEEIGQVQRKAAAEPTKGSDAPAATPMTTGSDAPAAVHDVLRSAGQPLDRGSRAFFEPRLGYDLSRVRVHADTSAAESARAVGALGYTVGDHVVLADGQAGPRALLAHELVHVIQQSPTRPVLRRFPPCRQLLNAAEQTRVPETDVQQFIATQAASLGTVERELSLPGASAAPYRTEPTKGQGGDVINPQTIGEDIFGRADLAVLTGQALDIIEVKEATWPQATFAEVQLLNYISKGNRAIRDVERLWRNRGHPGDNISSVRAMRMNRLAPETPQRIGGAVVSLAWCRDGVLSFKAIGDSDQDVFVCGVNDQGRIDGFLNRAMDPAQAAVERFISQEIEARATQALQGLSLKGMLQRVLDCPLSRHLVPVSILPVGQDQILDVLVQKLQPLEAQIRAFAQSFLHRVITELRQRMQAQIRTMLQEAMAALCAKTAQMTLRELLDEFDKRMRKFTLELMPVVVEAVAAQMISEMLAALGDALVEALKAVVVAVAVVITAIVLWEVAAAIAALEGIGALLVSLGATIARLLAQFFPIFD